MSNYSRRSRRGQFDPALRLVIDEAFVRAADVRGGLRLAGPVWSARLAAEGITPIVRPGRGNIRWITVDEARRLIARHARHDRP